MSSYSQNNTFDDILARMLARVDNSLDKREGSIIYDALAPAAAELAQCYLSLDIYQDQTNLMTATGINLDNRAFDFGLTRYPASKAIVVIEIKNMNNQYMNVDIGTRFSTPTSNGGIIFKILRLKSISQDGRYLAECETEGEVGNAYTGTVLPLQSINNLGSATITEIHTRGENTESDDAFRQRTIDFIQCKPFGGNIADYTQLVNSQNGVAECKIFPVWNGGGSVKVAILGPGHTIPSSDLVNEVQRIIDPTGGYGLGLAPIGHIVTVVAPTEDQITVTASLVLVNNVELQDIESSVKQKIKDYIYEVQSEFPKSDTLTVYTSRMIAAILNVSQVRSVTSLTINGEAEDYVIELDGNNVLYPTISDEDITLSEVTP